MRLTRKKAIELCIELWTWCMKTGKPKDEWPKWEEYDDIANYCWFCEYTARQNNDDICGNNLGQKICPYYKKYGHCHRKGKPYYQFVNAKTPRTRKKYAKLFLRQIQTLRG